MEQGQAVRKVLFYRDFCKRCGLCSAFCPQKIILRDVEGYPYAVDFSKCIGCRSCELHCPDFAICVEEEG
ncbi:4Fe-4S dicluster domain-containing protein [bacterium]|nr:MAG: 4Fe-4S dicluster domain-containing protein [bacterium]